MIGLFRKLGRIRAEEGPSFGVETLCSIKNNRWKKKPALLLNAKPSENVCENVEHLPSHKDFVSTRANS